MATAQIPWNDGSGHNISVEWDGTQDGEIKISSPTNPSLTAQRTKSIQVRTTAGSPQLTRTINVVQEAAVYTYEYSVTASSSATLAASGGSVTYTAQLKTYLQGDLLKTETVTPVCRIILGTGFSASGNKVTAASRGTEYATSTRSAQIAVEFETPETGETLSETVTVTQAANNRVIVYSKPNITDVSANDIPASGGSISSANVSYSQSRHYYYDSGATEELSALTKGGTINYGAAVTAPSLSTTIKNRAIVGTLAFTVSMNGQTSVEQDVSVYQAKNVPVDAAIGQHWYAYTSGAIPASGGTKAPSSNGSDVMLTWSSGSTSYVNAAGAGPGITIKNDVDTYSMVAATGFSINSSTGVITAENRGTTEGAVRNSGDCSNYVKWTITVSDTYGGGSFVVEDTKTLTTPVTQQANIATYGDVSLTVQTPVSCDVSGGEYRINPIYSQTVSFTTGATRAGNVSVTYTQKAAMDGFSLSGNIVTVTENKTTSARNGYTVTVKATGEGSKTASKDVVFNQSLGVKSYATPVITGFTYPTIAAKGGTVTPTVTYSQTWGWNESTTNGGTITTGAALSFSGTGVNTSTGAVTAGTKGTTVSSATNVTTATVKVTLNNKAATKTFTVQQAANAITSYGNVTISGGSVSDIPANGGSVSSMSGISASQTITYTSESTRAGTVKITYSTAISGSNLGTTIKNRTKLGTLTATATGEGSKTATKALDVYQAKNVPTKMVATANFSYPTGAIPASGGTKSPTLAGKANITWSSGGTNSLSAGSYTGYTIGSSRTWSMVTATGFSINSSTGVVTAADRGTTEGAARSCGNVSSTLNLTLTISDTYGGGTISDSDTDTLTTPITQQANTATYGNVTLNASNPATVAATGGTVTISASASQTVSFTSGKSRAGNVSLTYTQKTAVSGFSLSGNKVTVTANSTTSTRSYVVTVKATGEGSKTASKDVTVSQATGAKSYSDITLNVSYPTIAAKGGTVTPTVSYSQTWGWNGSTTGGGTITSGGTVTYSGTSVSTSNGAVTAGTKGTNVSGVTTVTTATVKVTLNGKTTQKQVTVQQAANAITGTTYSNPTVTISSVADIPAKGGSVSTGTASYSQTKTDTYTSGSSKPTTITSGGTVKWSTVSAGTKGTTVSARTEVDEITCTVTLNSKSGSATKMVYQAANSKNEVSRVITVSVPSGDIPAEGGTKTVTRSGVINYSFTSGATTTSSFTPTLSISGTGFSLNGTTVTAANRSTTVGERRSATITASYEGATSKTATVYQQENEVVSITYGTPQVVLNVSDIPASGGTVSSGIVNYLQSRTRHYTSGATSRMSSLSSGGVITYSDAVSGANLGTTEKERTKLGTLTATVTMNGKSDSDSADVYQEANVKTAGDISYGDWQVSVHAREYISASSPCPASGDSFTIYSSASRTRVQEYNYTSGATDTETLSTETATPELSVSGEGGLTLDGNTATYANRGTTEGNLRSNTILATYEGAYDTEQVYQEANVRTAGDISYGRWRISISANRYTDRSSPCPASGGTCTITASASRTRTQNYSYTSGDTSTEALANESGTPTLSSSGSGASLSGTTVTWESRGVLYSDAVRLAEVTATIDSTSAKVFIYQAKNEYTEEWNNPVVDMQPSSHTISNIGNDWYVDSFSATQSGIRTYDSGSTQSVTNSEFTWSSSENVSWLSSQVEFGEDFCITSDDNEGATSRSGVVTLTATGKGGKTGSDTITITQEAGSYLNVSPTSLSFEAAGGTKTITIDTNESWTIE